MVPKIPYERRAERVIGDDVQESDASRDPQGERAFGNGEPAPRALVDGVMSSELRRVDWPTESAAGSGVLERSFPRHAESR